MKNVILQIGPKGLGGIDTVISMICNSNLNKKFNIIRIATQEHKLWMMDYLKSILSCLKIFKTQNINLIVHIHLASTGSFYRKCFIASLCKRYNIPYIIHLHGACFESFYSNSNKLLKSAISKMFFESCAVIVLTPNWTNFMKKLGVLNQCHIIGNPVRLPERTKNIILDNAEFLDKVNILFLGRLGKRKGTFDLINAIPFVKEKIGNQKFSLILAGDGDIDTCKKMCKDLNIEKDVQIVGWVNETAKENLFLQTDILVLPSYHESFGLSLIEAMSYAIPIVASTGGSIPEVVDDRKDGYLVEPGDISDLADKLVLLIENKELRLTLGQNGRDHVEREFCEELFCKKLSDLYDSIINRL